ncbi:translation initiation factor IF-2-like [Felis catus]|uniref:translation initiation factor IF-2-like n=1 Tax=Felis catus TaxID=9685 RepID=UPI001D1A2FF5|nr:translation initiation factor IF-2-like [Felis catus]
MPPALQIPPCGPQLRPAEAENHGNTIFPSPGWSPARSISCAERSLEGLLLQRASLDLPIGSSSTFLPPPSAAGQGPHQWSWEGGEEAGRPGCGSGGGGEEGARRSSSTSSVSQSRYRRSRQSFPQCGEVWSQLSGPKLPTTHPGCPCLAASGPGPLPPRGLTATPGPPPRAPDSPPGRAPREERAEAGAGRCGLGICARRPRCPPPPGGGSGGAAAVTRRPRGGKARPLPAPPAAALPPPGTKETKPRRPGRASLLPPAPAGPPSPRPPPRPGRKQPGEPGARPRAARDPAFQPCGLRTCRGRGTRPLPVGALAAGRR